jgi:hypothetical protein
MVQDRRAYGIDGLNRPALYSVGQWVDPLANGSKTGWFGTDLYFQIAKDLIDRGNGENILAEAARSDRKTTADMPSWVPDWSEAPLRADFSNIVNASG